MIRLERQQDRSLAAQLFTGISIWRALVHSAARTRFGHLVVDDRRNPTVGVLFYGGNVIYAGNAESEAAGEIVRAFPVQPAILGHSPAWNRLIEKTFGDQLRTARRYQLPAESLDLSVTREKLAGRDEVWRPIARDDLEHVERDLGWEHHKYHYESPEDFLRRGNGFVITDQGRTAAGASSFVDSDTHVECQITTAPAFRRKGYGALVAAAYIERCHATGKTVPWDAAHEASVRLARSLGYRAVHEYTVYELFPRDLGS